MIILTLPFRVSTVRKEDIDWAKRELSVKGYTNEQIDRLVAAAIKVSVNIRRTFFELIKGTDILVKGTDSTNV